MTGREAIRLAPHTWNHVFIQKKTAAVSSMSTLMANSFIYKHLLYILHTQKKKQKAFQNWRKRILVFDSKHTRIAIHTSPKRSSNKYMYIYLPPNVDRGKSNNRINRLLMHFILYGRNTYWDFYTVFDLLSDLTSIRYIIKTLKRW